MVYFNTMTQITLKYILKTNQKQQCHMGKESIKIFLVHQEIQTISRGLFKRE